jgi:hypothetical protein
MPTASAEVTVRADEHRTSSPRRARRYPIHTPTLYRAAGSQEWHEGETENISRSGVLFRAANPMPLDTPIEIRLLVEFGDEQHSEIICCGRVARTESVPDDISRPAIAVTIDGYLIAPRNRDTRRI